MTPDDWIELSKRDLGTRGSPQRSQMGLGALLLWMAWPIALFGAFKRK